MEAYKQRLALVLAETGALFFDRNLVLKDGRPTPYFVNTAKFKTGSLSLEMGSFFAEMMVSRGLAGETDIILGPSYKGSSIALATAIALWKDHGVDLVFDYDRKEAKEHGEASGGGSMFVNQSLFDGCRLFVVDDVATSMRTKFDLLEKIGAEKRTRGISCRLQGIGIGIDRQQTTAVYDANGEVIEGRRGQDAIAEFTAKTGVSVYAVAGIREVVDYLFDEKAPVLVEGVRQPINQRIKHEFDEYIRLYGVSGS